MVQQIEDHLPPFRIRPRFLVETHESMDAISEKINADLSIKNSECKGKIAHGYGTIEIPVKDQHYWSPQLTLTIEETENGSSIRGLYAPRPAVWTMFVFFYAVLGFALLIITIIGFSNLSLKLSGSILWLVPILSVIITSLYLVSFFGQKLAHDQMVTLHNFIEKSIGITIDSKH